MLNRESLANYRSGKAMRNQNGFDELLAPDQLENVSLERLRPLHTVRRVVDRHWARRCAAQSGRCDYIEAVFLVISRDEPVEHRIPGVDARYQNECFVTGALLRYVRWTSLGQRSIGGRKA